MNIIKGIQKTSLVDYPPHIAMTLFLGGCNFKCGFCHNKDLVLNPKSVKGYSLKKVDLLIDKRKKWIDAVCISGGEPTLYRRLPALLKRIKKHGLLVKLDTNGTNPVMIKKLIGEGLIDYIAMDVKNTPKKYDDITNKKVNLKKIKKSVKLIMDSGVDYEFRTTVHPRYHSKKDIVAIGKWLKGARQFSLQQFDDKLDYVDGSITEEKRFSKKKLDGFAKVLRKYINSVKIKNV